MRSAARGPRTSETEVTNVSKHGVWLWLGDREVFLPYERFPWLADGTIREVLNVERISEAHLHWPDLDVDIDVDSIDHPEKYSLVSKVKRATRRDRG